MSLSSHFCLSNFGVEVAATDAVPELDAAPKIAAVVAVVTAAGFVEVSFVSSGGEEEKVEEAVETAAVVDFAGAEGDEKNDVMDAFALGFLAVLVAMSAALRLSGVAIKP